ncbi:MAG: hypothetical protein HC880_11430, partial [Bacteroidia bacterium]|nr:hypothetical protein [Bacteroidia bacterium]
EDYQYADKGFMEAMLLKLHVGDSATFVVNADDLFDATQTAPSLRLSGLVRI